MKYTAFYVPVAKCSSWFTWLWHFSRVCGRPAVRVCGWYFYPTW